MLHRRATCCSVARDVATSHTMLHPAWPSGMSRARWNTIHHMAATLGPTVLHPLARTDGLCCVALQFRRSAASCFRARCGPFFLRPARVGTVARCACSCAPCASVPLRRFAGAHSHVCERVSLRRREGEARLRPQRPNPSTRVPYSLSTRAPYSPTHCRVRHATRVGSERAQARGRCPLVGTRTRSCTRTDVHERARTACNPAPVQSTPSHRLPVRA